MLRSPSPERDGLADNHIRGEHAEIAAVKAFGHVAEEEEIAVSEREAPAPNGKRASGAVVRSGKNHDTTIDADDRS